MEKILDRFLRYVAIDTQSDENSESQPSAAKELDLLKLLCKELNDMGVEATLDEYGYVMGTIPSNIDKKVPAIGFIAHVDTSPNLRLSAITTAETSNSKVCLDSLSNRQNSLNF